MASGLDRLKGLVSNAPSGMDRLKGLVGTSQPKTPPQFSQQKIMEMAQPNYRSPNQDDINKLYQQRDVLKSTLTPYNQDIGDTVSQISAVDKKISDYAKASPNAQLRMPGARAYTEPYAAGVQKNFTGPIYSALEGVANFGDKILEGNVVSNILHDLYKADQAGQQITDQKLKEAQIGRGEGFKAYQGVAEAVGGAVPNAVLAVATGGTSAAAQLPEIAGSAGLTATIRTGLTSIAKNPQFKLSFVQNYGSSYQNAKDSGATEDEAQLTAIITGLVNSGIEVTGGIETFPAAIRSGSASAVREWVTSALSEGKEGMVQGIIERLTQKLVYDQNKPLVSMTDPNAVFNPKTSAQEGAMNTLVGGILSGGQVVTNKVMTSLPSLKTALSNPVRQNIQQPSVTPQNAPQATPTQGVSKDVQTPIPSVHSNVAAQTPSNTITSNMPEGMGAASNPYKTQTKTSEFFTNTLMNTDLLDDVAKSKLDARDYEFDSVSEKQSVARAKEALQTDFWGEVEDLSTKKFTAAEDTDKAMGILGSYARAAQGTEDYTEVTNWAKNVFPQYHEAAVVLQALDKYSRTPEGAVIKAVNAVEGEVKRRTTTKEGKTTKKTQLGKTIDAESKEVIDAVKEEGKQVANEVTDAVKNRRSIKQTKKSEPKTDDENRNHGTPVEKWADETGRLLSETFSKRGAPARQKPVSTIIYNDLVRFIESTMPDRPATQGRTAIERLIDYANNKAFYDKAYQAFLKYAAEKYYGNEEAMSEVEQLADMSLDDTVTKAVNEALDAIQVKLSEIVAKGTATKSDVARQITDMLIEKYGAENAETISKRIVDRFYEMLSERAKKRLAQMFKDRAPSKKQAWFAKLEELINLGAFDNASYTDVIREKYGLPTLSQADIKNIYEYMKKSNEAQSEYDKNMWLSRATRVVTDKFKSSPGDYIRMIRRISMLMNPKTLISRNAGGNLIFSAVENLKDLPAAGIDLLVSRKTGLRSKAFAPISNLTAQARGFKQGIVEIGKDVKNQVNTSPTSHEMNNPSFNNLQPTTTFKGNNVFGKIGKGAENALNILLQAGDRPFYQAAYAQRMNELTKLGKDIASDDSIMDATQYALTRVFQNNSALAKKASQMREALGPLGDIVLPFVQTPANIFNVLAEYTPAGFAKAVYQWGKMNGKGGTNTVFSQRQFVDTLARAFTGTGIMTLGYFLAKAGLLMGRLPDDDKKAQAEKLAGKQEYSIILGDKSYTYDWASPIGALLAIGADMYGAGVDKKGFTSTLVASGEAGLDVMFQQSYLEGLSQLFGYNDFTKGLEQTFANLPASFIPTGLSQLAKVIDTTQRETYDQSALKQVANKIFAKIPGLSMTLQPKVSTSGANLPNFNGRPTGSNIVESFLSPGYVGQSTATKVDAEMMRLYSSTGETELLPPVKPDKSFDANGTYTMTAEEYAKFQQVRNSEIYRQVNSLMSSDAYRKAGDSGKAEMIADVAREAREMAKQTIVEGRGEMYLTADGEEKVQTYADTGITQQKAYSLYKDLKALKPEGSNKDVTIYQKINTVLKQDVTSGQKVSLIATFYTSRYEDGNTKNTSLLPYLNNASRIVSLYMGSKSTDNPNGDSSIINMTIPAEFSEKKTTYTLTEAEKNLFKKTYTEFFNSRVTALSTADQIKKIDSLATEAAKKAVIRGRG